jgi:peptidoglycan/xylan/chitin deacetylase (PgdA/CDA1 family)
MRILSLTFDDGFLESAKKIDAMIPYKSTFYIVTGWVKPNSISIKDHYNVNKNHGTLDDWIGLSKKGHDIQSHTVSHHSKKWFSTASVEQIEYEYNESMNFIKKIHNGPYTMSTPYHHIPRIKSNYMAIRIGIENGFKNKFDYLRLDSLNSYQGTSSWAINNLPDEDNVWILACLHGLDEEGYCPWTVEELSNFCKVAIDKKYKIQTVNQVLKRFYLP